MRLRQIAFVAKDLKATTDELCSVLGLDVAYRDPGVGKWGLENIVAPIDDLVSAENVDLSQWYEGCINAITVEGNLLGLPFKSHPGLAVIYYNQTAFEAAGLELPKAGWTQAEQIEMAKALTNREAAPPMYGFLPGTGSVWKTMVALMRAS